MQLMHIPEDIVVAIDNELGFATRRFGIFNSAHEGYAVILEELEELKTEVFKHKEQREVAALKKEAVQVAAMAVRFITDIVKPLESKRR